jgi:DNA topoisomerase-3
MKVCIAEKPSVAKSIAAILGATSKKDGYMEGNGWAVTWAFGHLVGLAMPEAYGYTGFQKENLPILPKEFILVPRQVKEGKEYKNDPGVMKQLKIIKELFSKADGIIVCTDAGREGELIHRYIYDYLGCTRPCQRLWISSLTDKAIKEGFQNLRPGSDYDNLYLSAKARSQADWVVGLNASQALSIAAGRGSWSLGRMQTPTLAMICSRYLENKDFKPQTYFKLKLHTVKDATTVCRFVGGQVRYPFHSRWRIATGEGCRNHPRYGCRKERSKAGAAIAVRPDHASERGQQQARFFSRQNAEYRASLIRIKKNIVSTHRK